MDDLLDFGEEWCCSLVIFVRIDVGGLGLGFGGWGGVILLVWFFGGVLVWFGVDGF